MAETVLGLYAQSAATQIIIRDLEAHGFPREQIHVTSEAGRNLGAVIDPLIGFGLPRDEAEHYARGVQDGGTLIRLSCAESELATARRVMASYRPIRLDGWPAG